MVTLTVQEAIELATRAFIVSGASDDAAESTARALIRAEIDGQKGHGLTRVQSYTAQVRSGKINGTATPLAEQVSDVVVTVDAGHGFAYPAIDQAIEQLLPMAQAQHLSAATISRSHHFGQAGAHAERLAQEGLIALVFGNSPKGIAFWGSAQPMMGTNPIAFAAPAPGRAPIVIDLAVSVTARGKIVAADKAGEAIPEGWALDAQGQPTTDAAEALKGSMVPMGGAKGAALALMVEILAAALTGSAFGFEASSLFTGEGPAPDLGQTIVVINPGTPSRGFYPARITSLLTAIAETDGARVPGDSRLARRDKAQRDGLEITPTLHNELIAHAEGRVG